MSVILDMIKEKIQNSISIEVQPTQYGKYPVIVTDKSNSVTAGWKLVYRVQKNQNREGVFDPFSRFSELHITNFSQILQQLQQIYVRFRNGEGVENRYDTLFATYDLGKLWFTSLKKTSTQKDTVSITMTILDDDSPFHMLSSTFRITISEQNNQPYLVGYDSNYNRETDTFIDKYNSFMLPSKRRYIPVNRDESLQKYTAKVGGHLTSEGLVALEEEQTDFVFVQEISNERRLLASLYEKTIMSIAFEYAAQHLPESFNQDWTMPNAFGQGPQNNNVNFNAFNPMAQDNPFPTQNQRNQPVLSSIGQENAFSAGGNYPF